MQSDAQAANVDYFFCIFSGKFAKISRTTYRKAPTNLRLLIGAERSEASGPGIQQTLRSRLRPDPSLSLRMTRSNRKLVPSEVEGSPISRQGRLPAEDPSAGPAANPPVLRCALQQIQLTCRKKSGRVNSRKVRRCCETVFLADLGSCHC